MLQECSKVCWPQKQKLDDKIMQRGSKDPTLKLITQSQISNHRPHSKKKNCPRAETHTCIKCRCCSSMVTKSTTRNRRLKKVEFADAASPAGIVRQRGSDTMTQSAQGVHASCTDVCILPNVLPILFHEIPSGPRWGSLLQLRVYLKLCLVYLMNGCLGKKQGG